eukprot:5427576-Amphidinium_carterae.3
MSCALDGDVQTCQLTSKHFERERDSGLQCGSFPSACPNEACMVCLWTDIHMCTRHSLNVLDCAVFWTVEFHGGMDAAVWWIVDGGVVDGGVERGDRLLRGWFRVLCLTRCILSRARTGARSLRLLCLTPLLVLPCVGVLPACLRLGAAASCCGCAAGALADLLDVAACGAADGLRSTPCR